MEAIKSNLRRHGLNLAVIAIVAAVAAAWLYGRGEPTTVRPDAAEPWPGMFDGEYRGPSPEDADRSVSGSTGGDIEQP